jgi:glucose-6-phosphate 1-dehydrogenase
MFDNAMNGETRHFAQIDGIVEAWRVLATVLSGRHEIHSYAAGTDGPDTSVFDA